MEVRGRNIIAGSKINTLEESLKFFEKPCLLDQLDTNLELVRREKATKEDHLRLLKSVDKNLLKLSRKHHPDKAIKEQTETTNAQDRQIALNATRTVLKALTEVFLKDIDVHYKYEFFAKLDINTLVNEKQIDLEINNVLCKISRLSEIKRVNIVGEIRNFLLECRTGLESFRQDDNREFAGHRDNALHHLRKCIEGYGTLATECALIMEECSEEEDGNTRRVMQNMYEQSLRENGILQDLQGVAKRSLGGTFEVFPIYKPVYNDPMFPVKYEPVVPQELDYFVSPFLFYVDVLLMCSVMVDKKPRWPFGFGLLKTVKRRTSDYWIGNHSEESIYFLNESALLKAYQLASYFSGKNHYKEQVQDILGGKDPENNVIREAFKETVVEIEQHLAEQFDINSYKEGKSNLEQFNKRLSELNGAMAGFEEMEKNLLEKFKLYENETIKVRKEYSELSKKIEKTVEERLENISKYGSTKEKC